MSDSKKIHHLRENYSKGELSETSIDKNPLVQFQKWFDEAVTEKIPEPNAFILATSMIDFKPSARVMLLKGVENDSFVFFTNYESRKGKELTWNPYAAMVFLWLPLQRQVRIEGRVEKISMEESEKYFQSRPRESQLGTLASQQSTVIENRNMLEAKYAELEKKYEGKEIPKPDFWGGFKVIPAIVEFWQGRPSRMHDRIRYMHTGENNWLIERLSP